MITYVIIGVTVVVSYICFGNHELFHLFVMAGSFCHYMLAYLVLCPMAV